MASLNKFKFPASFPPCLNLSCSILVLTPALARPRLIFDQTRENVGAWEAFESQKPVRSRAKYRECVNI